MVIDKDKNLRLKGKGHEASDLMKVMRVYKDWHFQSYPKLEFSYFIERIQKQGNDKAMKPFLSKLRNVYKGHDVLEEFADLNK